MYETSPHPHDDLPAVAIDIEAIGNLTLRLAQILAEEVDLLDAMRISDIAALQTEKTALTNALEKQKQILIRHPDMLERMDPEDREYLQQIIAVFEDVMEENHRRLLSARDINLAMIDAIKDTIQEYATRGVYSIRGVSDANTQAFSVTLNNVV